MSARNAADLEDLLRENGLGWAIDLYSPPRDAAKHYLRVLKSLAEFLRERNLPTLDLSPKGLRAMIRQNPWKGHAFLQALVSVRSLPILCAALRMIQGAELVKFEAEYHRLIKFRLSVELRAPDEAKAKPEIYESSEIEDMTFLRHLSCSRIDGKPFVDGFFALKLKARA